MEVCRCILLSAVFLGPVEIAVALDTTKLLSQYRVDIWHVRDGLPQESVRAITQTSNGYQNTPAFEQGDHVLSLHADRDSGLWIGTSVGVLLCGKNGVFRTYSASDGLPAEPIRSILTARDGTLWIGMERGGLHRFDSRRFIRVPLQNVEDKVTVRCSTVSHQCDVLSCSVQIRIF